MVCLNNSKRNQMGKGIEALLKPFTVNKYGQERHARSLDPNHFLENYAYTGPGTEVRLRETLGDNHALNALDAASKEHDYAYLKEQEEYNKDQNKIKHLHNIWHADDVFIKKASSQTDDTIIGKLASTFISAKENLEKADMLDSKNSVDLEQI